MAPIAVSGANVDLTVLRCNWRARFSSAELNRYHAALLSYLAMSCDHVSRVLQVLGLALFVGTLSIACSSPDEEAIAFPQVDLPVLQNLESVDRELAEYIAHRHAAVLLYPTSASERGRLAMAYDVNGWHEAAVDIYDQAHTLDPFEFMWPYFASLLAASQGDFESALVRLNSALVIDSEYVAGWLAKGAWLLQLDRFDDAKSAFEVAYSIDGNIYAIVGKAQVFLRAGDSQSAKDLLEPLSQRTLHPQIFRLLAQAYEDLGRSENARVAKALGKKEGVLLWQDPLIIRREIHIRGFGGRLAKAQRLLQAQRVEEALIELTGLHAEHADKPSLISSLAWAYSARGDVDLAIETLQIGIEDHPNHQPFYTQLGDLLSIAGSLDVAFGLLQKSIELNDSDSEAHFKLGFVLMQLDALDDAVESFTKALDLGSNSASQIHIHLGTIAGYRRDWDRAIVHFKRSIELDPRSVIGHERLCVVYIEAGKFDELETALEWAAKLAIPDEEFEFVRQYRDEVQSEPQ